ncbi:MAG: MmgE/PrpD family protein [Actinomycetales bacterium]
MEAPVTTAVAQHIADADALPLKPEIAERAKQHLLDSIIAILSGAHLKPGRLAADYASSRGGAGESTVAGGPRTTAELAAFANAVSAHADETDDVNNRARIHPGSSIVPAAIAMGEALDSAGSSLLIATSLGYDIAGSVNVGAWRSMRAMDRSPRTTHGLGQTFGAAAAAASLAGYSMEQNRHVLSYAAHQVAGISTIYRDPEHVGKAFATAALQAQAGVKAVELVRFGFTGVHDVFDVSPNVFDAFGEEGSTERMLEDLRHTRHVTMTDIKQYPVGGPIQPAAQALEHLLDLGAFRACEVSSIDVHLPTAFAYIVNDRPMPDINLSYIMSVMLLDGRITFQNSHDYERFSSPPVRDLMDRVRVVADPGLDVSDAQVAAAGRSWSAAVTVRTRDGRELTERVEACHGSRSHPMSWERLRTKAHMTLAGTMPDTDVDDLITWVKTIDRSSRVRELRTFFRDYTS